jgi:hypothetical protein
MSDVTRVIFRKWGRQNGGEVIALFPDEAGKDGEPGFCLSYEHVGQHGAADPHGVVDRTRPATREEYAELKAELEGKPYGYTLRVLQRIPASSYGRRVEQLDQR